MIIYLVRHAEIGDKNRRRLIGQLDLPLNENGKKQAKALRKKLSAVDFDCVYSSDLSRTMDTARTITGKKRQINIIPELREINLGKWEGLFADEAIERFPREWKERWDDIAGYRPPEGESFNDLRDRVIPAFDRIAELNAQNVLVITHGGVIRTILCHILEMPLRRLFSLHIDYAGISLIDCGKKPFRLVAMNIPL